MTSPATSDSRLGSTAVLDFAVEGMTCASCASRIERVLSRQPGVEAASVNLASRSATVRLPDQIDPQALGEAVRRIGYDMSFSRPDEPPRGLADAYAT